MIGDPKWGPDYSIEIKVRNAKGVWLGIHLRWLDTDHHYDWWIDMNNKKACLYIKKGAYTQKTIVDIPLDINKEFTINLAIEGFVLSGYFNDKLVNKWQDEDGFLRRYIIYQKLPNTEYYNYSLAVEAVLKFYQQDNSNDLIPIYQLPVSKIQGR